MKYAVIWNYCGMNSRGKCHANNTTMIQIIFKESSLFVEKRRIFAAPSEKKTMIQRIQSFYLFLVLVLAGVLPFFLKVWTTADATAVYAESLMVVLIAFMVSAGLAVISIALYKNRQHQFVLNRLNMILNLFLLGFFVYRSLNLSGETEVSEKGIGMLIPVFSIVFLVLANRAIKKDEDLVKSVDRLR